MDSNLQEKPTLYMVFVQDGVLPNDGCYLRGSNFYAESEEDAFNQFLDKSRLYWLTLNDVNITKV